MSASFLKIVRPGIVSVTTGGWLGTVTRKLCVARSPSSSVAVTVTIASPLASPVIVRVLPDTVAPTTSPSDTAAS